MVPSVGVLGVFPWQWGVSRCLWGSRVPPHPHSPVVAQQLHLEVAEVAAGDAEGAAPHALQPAQVLQPRPRRETAHGAPCGVTQGWGHTGEGP